MRFKKYLTENINEEDFIQLLEKNCKKYLSDLAKVGEIDTLPMSGRKNKPEIFKGKIRKNRIPTDTPEHIHKFIDNKFEREFNVRPRSNAIFLTTAPMTAEVYGEPYYIFPIGNYETLWSPKISDLGVDLRKKILKEYKSKEGLAQIKIQKYEDIVEDIVESFKKGPITKQMLKERSSNEIMVLGDSYYAISVKKASEIKLLKKLKKNFGIKISKSFNSGIEDFLQKHS